MKHAKNLFRLALVAIMGLMFATCQKDAAVMLNPDSETDIAAPRLKTGGVTDYLMDLVAEIEALVDGGSLSPGNGNALIVKLNAAIKNLDKGNYDAAIGILAAFMDLVGDLVCEGKISPELGDELVEVSFDWQCGDPIVDLRDLNIYSTVQIGEQCWFSENLAYLPSVSHPSIVSNTDPYYYVYDYTGADLSDAKATDNYGTYGVLYNLPAANIACPAGWHLPSDEEWKTLEMQLGMSVEDANQGMGFWRKSGEVGKQLKSESGWLNDGNGDNSSGFNALPGGLLYESTGVNFHGLICQASFWSSTFKESSYAWDRGLFYENDWVFRFYYQCHYGFSVRCLRD